MEHVDKSPRRDPALTRADGPAPDGAYLADGSLRGEALRELVQLAQHGPMARAQRERLRAAFGGPASVVAPRGRVVQRIIVQGSDAQEDTPTNRSGMIRLVSAAEIANTADWLREEGRHKNKDVCTIDTLPQDGFDAMNYLNGHFDGGRYLGLEAKEMADRLVAKGLRSGQNLTLTGCESADFGGQLKTFLAERGVNVVVIGARGIAFDHKNDVGQVVESQFDKGQIPANVNAAHNTAVKLAVATKYEALYLNQAAQAVLVAQNALSEEDKSAFVTALRSVATLTFQRPGAVPDNQLAERLTGADRTLGSNLGRAAAQGDPVAQDAYRAYTDEELITAAGRAAENPIPYRKAEIFAMKAEIARRLNKPQQLERNEQGVVDQARSGGNFVLAPYTDISVRKVQAFNNALGGRGAVWGIIGPLYFANGRLAANEYVKKMSEGYTQHAANAVIQQGWVAFEDGDTQSTFGTYRDAADTYDPRQ